MHARMALAALLLCATQSFAQDTFADDTQKALSPNYPVPFGGMTAPDRYRQNMYAVPLWLYGFDRNEFETQRMLDRLERQEKFGHLWASSRKGSEFQVQRILNEYDQQVNDRPRVSFSVGGFFGRVRR